MKKQIFATTLFFLSIFSTQLFAELKKDFSNQYKPVSEYAKNKAEENKNQQKNNNGEPLSYKGSNYKNTAQNTAWSFSAGKENIEEEIDTSGGAVKFEFKYKKGDSYRILSTVNEDVLVDSVKKNSTVILNRVTARVTETDENGGAIHEGTFMTSEESLSSVSGKKFTYGEEYESVFHRDRLGVYDIEKKYFMPTVRDVPVFTDREVLPGDTWTANGHEAHDMRRGWGIEDPYIVPFVATYTYLGKITEEKKEIKTMSYAQSSLSSSKNNSLENKSSKTLHVLNVKYTMYFQSPEMKQDDPYADYPFQTMGFSDETIYWDADEGRIDHYRENFRIMIDTKFGHTYEFRGSAHAEVTDFIRSGTKENVENIQKQVDEIGLDNVTVKQGEKGLTISLSNIKFKADSAELLESEKEKLSAIADILKSYPENDILVTGHTALAGTEKVRQILSEERAEAVADYLVQLGLRDRYHIFTRGLGAKEPVSDNKSEEGKAKNRRVEITILDK